MTVGIVGTTLYEAGVLIDAIGSSVKSTSRDAYEKIKSWLGGISAKKTNSEIPKWSGSGPIPGVLGVNENSISSKAIQNYYPKTGSVEFVFDAKTNTFVVGKPQNNVGGGSPHQNLANTINADQGAKTTLGGTFSRGQYGEIYTTENSGHFGKNWTEELRAQFVETMKGYGLNIKHEKWN